MTTSQKVFLGVAAAWAVIAAWLLVAGNSRERIYIVLFTGVAVTTAGLSAFRRR